MFSHSDSLSNIRLQYPNPNLSNKKNWPVTDNFDDFPRCRMVMGLPSSWCNFHSVPIIVQTSPAMVVKKKQMQRNSGSNILITGASSGIGRALAIRFAEPGVSLYLCARNLSALQNTSDACRNEGANVEIAQVDVRQNEAVKAWIDQIAEKTRIDLVIANAGVLGSHGEERCFEDTETAQLQIATNLGGSVNVVTSVVPHMQKQKGGQIALISSLSSLQPIADMPAYAASKAGLNAYGEAISFFLHADGIDVSVICPGFIKSPMAEKYASWRPLEMTADKAAARIKRAIARKRAFYAFPLALYAVILLGRLVPWRLRRLTTKGFNYQR
ncbi:MAG: SDR family NAD(P)-dependent oxidoreductase [Roseibium sp.]|uniref:SDR family NAD(P)-dependent oxidoreductase n=1 Tax=Roseibium sp. TaxID=1936156 RepID=UPI003D9C35C6